MNGTGILSLWKDCVAGHEAEMEHWFQSEHLAERVGVPGFRRGRRYEAVEARRHLFTYYETDTPEVLTSAFYLERLDNPTPLTRRIMSGIMVNMSRTICRVEHSAGNYRGAFAVTAILADADSGCDAAIIANLASMPGVARAQSWASAEDVAPPVSDEERLRGGDEKIPACLIVETLRESDAKKTKQALRERLGEMVTEIGIYRFLCELEK